MQVPEYFQHRRARTITLGQRQYILDVLERFNIGDCDSIGTLLAKGSTDSEGISVIQIVVPYNKQLDRKFTICGHHHKAGHQHGKVALKLFPCRAEQQGMKGRKKSVALL